MTTREVLVEARKLIEKPEDWAPDFFELGHGNCAATAVSKAHGRPYGSLTSIPAYQLLRRLAGGSLGSFNDSHTHAEVLDLFTRAIEAA